MIEKIWEYIFTRDPSLFKDMMFNIWDAGIVIIILWIVLAGTIGVAALRSGSYH